VGRVFGITTSLQLLELARPTHPLFRQLLMNAPGTYHHSIVLSNMAERAAETIGADALLTRVGAYYHDIGKLTRPYFFAENQSNGENPHDKLDPKTSADIIIGHVTDGMDLARKYRLPRRIDDFILEHHGTMVTRYQHNQAVQAAGGDASKVDIEKFRYPGPRPQSRETALLMLADGTEARTRAQRPNDEESIRKLVLSTIEAAQKQGQLDDTKLTLRDLGIITDAFVTILKGTHHPRIAYPKEIPAGEDVATVPHKP